MAIIPLTSKPRAPFKRTKPRDAPAPPPNTAFRPVDIFLKVAPIRPKNPLGPNKALFIFWDRLNFPYFIYYFHFVVI